MIVEFIIFGGISLLFVAFSLGVQVGWWTYDKQRTDKPDDE